MVRILSGIQSSGKRIFHLSGKGTGSAVVKLAVGEQAYSKDNSLQHGVSVNQGVADSRRPSMCHEVRFEIEPLNSIDALETEWRSVELHADNHVFLSWFWISNWLGVYHPEVKVLRAFAGNKLVGIALITVSAEKRHGFIRARTLRLHQTGIPEEDQIWIEHNAVLVHGSYQDQVDKQWLKFLVEEFPDWDEINLASVSDSRIATMEKSCSLLRSNIWSVPCYGVDLQSLRDRGQTYLQSLSRNTRYQINRSLRLFSSCDFPSIAQASTAEQALEFFSEAGKLHQQRWGVGRGQSGFANPEFVDFHERFISEGIESGSVELIKIEYTPDLKCYFYNFIYRGRVYFYLSGIPEVTDSRLKPGLAGHALCIENYLDRGFKYYDFMGGNERYKSNLGTLYDTITTARLQKRKTKFYLENQARKIKSRIF